MITEEALAFLSQQFANAKGPHVVNVPNEASHVQRVFLDGKLDEFVTSPPLRQVQLHDLPALIAMTKRLAAPDTSINNISNFDGFPAKKEEAAISVSSKYVRLYLNINDLREYFYVPLVESDAYSFFAGLSGKNYLLGQIELLEALRFRLVDTLPTEDQRRAYVKSLGKVQWQTTDTNEVVRTRGNDTLGRSINERIVEQENVGLPPEFLVFNVNRYINVPVSCQGLSIVCAFDMEASQRKFVLRPLGPTWETYLYQTVAQIVAYLSVELKDTGIPVYMGTLNTADR